MPNLDKNAGGVYQYSITMMEALSLLQKTSLSEDVFIVLSRLLNKDDLSRFNIMGWESCLFDIASPRKDDQFKEYFMNKLKRFLAYDGIYRIWNVLKSAPLIRSLMKKSCSGPDADKILYRNDIKEFIMSKQVRFMVYPAPSPVSFECGIPFITAIHDLEHRIHPEFPEVSRKGEWEWREYLFRNCSRYAIFVLVDSEIGKEDVLEYYGQYGVTADRVKVLPFIPTCYLSGRVPDTEQKEVLRLYNLPEQFFFYPAQFWPHKNHVGIVNALYILHKEYNCNSHVVFVGSHTGEIRQKEFKNVMRLAKRLNVSQQIHYLGYVSDKHISSLYMNAVALIMPTFFGPTNIPVLEAWSLGCPVITSDIRGIRQHAGEAAVLVDPHSAEAIAHGMYTVMQSADVRKRLVANGKYRLSMYNQDEYRQILSKILQEAKAIAVAI